MASMFPSPAWKTKFVRKVAVEYFFSPSTSNRFRVVMGISSPSPTAATLSTLASSRMGAMRR
jgi:hypothetical protein